MGDKHHVIDQLHAISHTLADNFCMGVLYEVFVVEIESLQIRLHWCSSRRKMEAPCCLPPPKFSSLSGNRVHLFIDEDICRRVVISTITLLYRPF